MKRPQVPQVVPAALHYRRSSHRLRRNPAILKLRGRRSARPLPSDGLRRGRRLDEDRAILLRVRDPRRAHPVAYRWIRS